MTTTHRERLETTWRFEEPDRVPIEIAITQDIRENPKAARLVELIDEHASNLSGVQAPSFGFLGMPTDYTETVVEKTEKHTRMERVHKTPAGVFTAITYHPADNSDYHWQKRFISTLEDLHRIVEMPRRAASWDRDAYARGVSDLDGNGLPCMWYPHPLGTLVRNADMEEVYGWFRSEPELIHRYLEVANAQVIETLESMEPFDDHQFCFASAAHEMLIPPWMGHELFDEFVFPYDVKVNEVIRKRNGRLRAHCHGNCMDFLVKFADMGIGGTEPLEPPPYADVDLAEAKRLVGDRMFLAGNIPSQAFPRISLDEVRELVHDAIRIAAPGGGFALRTTGGAGGTSTDMDEETMTRVIVNCEAFMEAGLEYGRYPIS